MKKILLLCATFCLAAAVAACGSESSYTSTEGDTGTATATASPESTSAAAETVGPTITIANMSFGDPITVAPGAKITVKNNDSAEHSVTSRDDGKFEVHVDGGDQGTLTAPTEPGEYAFYCVYHPSMRGTLIVK
jgi:plastocyanin